MPVQTRSKWRALCANAYKKQLEHSEPPCIKIEADEAEKEKCGMNLCESGMGELVYHLGFCSDVIGDCWIEHYYSGGVSGLKKQLRKSSEYVHKHGNCKECESLIDGIHD
jgi:hypothetical protein